MNKFDLIPYCMYCEKENTGHGFGDGMFHFWCAIKNLFDHKYEKQLAARVKDFERHEMENERWA